jgi:hypothetical protein
VQVEIWIDDLLFTTVAASSKRDGLAWSKVTPDPNHGWTLTTPGVRCSTTRRTRFAPTRSTRPPA